MRSASSSPTPAGTTPPEWVAGPSELPGTSFTLRELRPEDALLLLETSTVDEMTNLFRSTPALGCDPSIWAHGQRQADTHVCFAVVPAGTHTAVGIVQMRCEGNPIVQH